MKWLITGLNGTLAPVLAREAASQGVEVLAWSRHAVPPDDAAASQAWLQAMRPDAIAHLGMGSAQWAGQLAGYAAGRELPFVYTSSAMVFHHEPDGPHAPGDARTAQDDYGRYKIACEDAVHAAHPGASVVRIGWQIDPAQPGNNMLMALDEWQASQGRVAASWRWKPACSFMADTARALARLLHEPAAGVVHLDGNAQEGHSFLDIVLALQAAFDRPHWRVHAHDDYVHDQRLVGGPVRLAGLSETLVLPFPSRPD
ncbi:MAG: sugar nucleotide-binding protein [Rubrivivax sp.]